MAMDSVLISYFISFEKIGFYELFNELSLFFIGISFGIMANLFLRKKVFYMAELRRNVDEQNLYLLIEKSFLS